MVYNAPVQAPLSFQKSLEYIIVFPNHSETCTGTHSPKPQSPPGWIRKALLVVQDKLGSNKGLGFGVSDIDELDGVSLQHKRG